MQMRNFWHEKLLCDTVLVSADGTESLGSFNKNRGLKSNEDLPPIFCFWLVVMTKKFCKHIAKKCSWSHGNVDASVHLSEKFRISDPVFLCLKMCLQLS